MPPRGSGEGSASKKPRLDVPVRDRFPESNRLCPREMTSIYGKKTDLGLGIFASVNAGAFDLEVVSEGGISKQFAKMLEEGGQDVKRYGELHRYCLDAARTHGSGLRYRSSFPEKFRTVGVRAVFTQMSPLCDTEKGEQFCINDVMAGTVFVDVFEKDKCPAGDPRNQAMVYVIGPMGSKVINLQADASRSGVLKGDVKENAFLDACRSTGESVSKAVRDFNKAVKADETYEHLEYLRVCLISGGVFCHPTTSEHPDMLAEALITGVANEYDVEHSPKIEFASGPDFNPFLSAFQKL